MYLADIGQGVETAFKRVEQATRGITSGTFTVNRDNVLAAGRIIESQSDALRKLWLQNVKDLRIEAPGNDDVSTRVSQAWNDRLVGDDDCYKNRVKEYIDGLKKLAVQLGDTAKAYGFTEEEISAAFGTTVA